MWGVGVGGRVSTCLYPHTHLHIHLHGAELSSPTPLPRFLGTRAVRLFEVRVNGLPAVLSLSSRAWLAYVHQGRSVLAPLSYEELESATPFFSEQCPEGLVCVTGMD